MTGIVYRKPKIRSIRFPFVYNTASIASGVVAGVIPQNAIILWAQTSVLTAFNAGGTDLLRIGISAGGIEIANDEDISTVGLKTHYLFANLNPLVADRTIYVRYVGSGGAPNAGAAEVRLQWQLG